MAFDFEIKDLPAYRTLIIKRSPTMDKVPDAFMECLPKVFNHAGEHIVGPPFGRYTRWSEEGCDVEIGMPVSPDASGDGEIEVGEIPAAKTLCVLHMGSYSKLGDTHMKCHKWFEENGKTPGSPWEAYISDPSEVPEDELQTMVYWPIANSG